MSLVAVVLMEGKLVMCLMERELVLSSARKFEFEGPRSRTLMPAIAGKCHFATVVLEVLLEESSWKRDSRCTQILLFATAVVVKFATVVAMRLLGECGQECCNRHIQLALLEVSLETETAVVMLCRAVLVVK